MPKHIFSFHRNVREQVKEYVMRAIDGVDPRRYNQEPIYVTALAQALEGTAYEGPHGLIKFQFTMIDDRGSGAAQKWSGTDLVITAEISDPGRAIQKAILVQAKKGRLNELLSMSKKELLKQIRDMKNLTRSPKVLEIGIEGNDYRPSILSGNIILQGRLPKSYPLGDYFVQRVLTTMDGDTRPDFVAAAQESGLSMLRLKARKT